MNREPIIYHDIKSIQLIQFINGYLTNHDIVISLYPDIQDMYENIALTCYKSHSVLLKGTERIAIIAHCIHQICLINHIKSNEFEVARKIGLTKKRFLEIQHRYNLS